MNDSEQSKAEPASVAWCGLHAFMGGAFYGLVDGASVLASETLAMTKPQEALVMCTDALALGLLCTVLCLPIKWAVDRIRPGILTQPAWTLFLVGLTLCGTLDFAEHWFTAPPPHTEAPPFHGHLGVFFALVSVLLIGAFLLGNTVRPGRRRFVAILAICGSLMVWSQSNQRVLVPLGTPAPEAPNILLVSLDTARADHFGVYNPDFVETPNFDSVADDGARFDLAIAQIPVTGPSHTTILSGLGPWTHGGLLNGIPVDPEVPLITETLRSNGYRTGAFISAYVLDRTVGLERGFQVYDDDFGTMKGWSRTLAGRLIAGLGRRLNPTHVLERTAGPTVDRALDWLNTEGTTPGIPFFAWVHLFDPHGPYEPPEPWDTHYYDGDPRDPSHTSFDQVQGVAEYLLPSLEGIRDVQWVLDQYAGEISYADEQIGRLLGWLEENELATNTLVIIVGDHGESLGEHDTWFNHGDDLFEPSMRVPLAMRFPGNIRPGVVVEAPVELNDLVPTIHEFAGLDAPNATDGVSLVPSMFGGRIRSEPAARSICFDREANIQGREQGLIQQPTWRMVAIRTEDSRYVLRETEPDSPHLYRILEDPEELTPEVPGEDESSLRILADSVMNGMSREAVERSGSTVDPEVRQNLEALGYVE